MGNKNGVRMVRSSSFLKNSRQKRESFIQYADKPTNTGDLSEMFHRLWSFESFGIFPDAKLPVNKKNARGLKLLEENVIYTGERYEAPLLWATNHPDLPDNFAVALARF
jgi:hypothetical protein